MIKYLSVFETQEMIQHWRSLGYSIIFVEPTSCKCPDKGGSCNYFMIQGEK